MTQESYVAMITVIYQLSSGVGFALFAYIWWQTYRDHAEMLSRINGEEELHKIVSRRNVTVAGILTVVFAFYTLVGTIAVLRIAGVDLPWERGVVTITLLVLGNVLEMVIAVILVRYRSFFDRS
jgi:hypothetical protein